MSISHTGNLPLFTTFEDTEVFTTADIIKDIEQIQNYLAVANFDLVANEGLISAIARLLSGICNTLLHVVHTAKTNIFRSYRSLKRTELVYYKESNSISYMRILNCDYGMLTTIEVPVPNKMSAPYLPTSTSLMDFLATLNMETRVKFIVNFVKDLRDKVISGVGSEISGGLLPVQDLKGITDKFSLYNKCFSDTKISRGKKFTEVFPVNTDFRSTADILLKSADYQYGVSRIESSLDVVVNNLTAVVNAIQKNEVSMTKQELTALSDLSMYYAKLFDMFGVGVQDLSRVEHNFVEVMKHVRKVFNL